MTDMAKQVARNPEALAIGVICLVLGAGNMAPQFASGYGRQGLHMGFHELVVPAPQVTIPDLPAVPEAPQFPCGF